MARVTYTLDDFIHDMTRLVESEPDQAVLFDRASSHLARLLANPDAVAQDYRLPMPDRTPEKQSTTYLLHQAPSGLSITSVVWAPGSHIGPHDHGTWGMIGVVENTMTETRFRRLDDRSQDDYALLEQDRVTQNKPGEITLLVPDVDEIHQMDNLTNRPTPEIHVYGIDLLGWSRRRFDPETGKITRFATARWDNC